MSNRDPAVAVDKASASVVRVASGCNAATGFVLDDQGHVLTSAHALRGAGDKITVSQGDTSREATLLGADRGTDLALLRLEGAPLGTPASFADPAALKVGQLCLALGRPGRSVRASLRIVGVLAKDFRLPRGDQLEHYVESDRHVPSGFGGGPLVDLDGRVIGMNTRAALRGADVAITRPTVDRIVAALHKGGIERGYLGVGVHGVDLPAALHATAKHGALLVALDDDGPAVKAGLTVGDILVEVAGQKVEGPRDLQRALFDKAGQRIKVKVVRGGQVVDLEVEAGKRAS